LLICNRLADDDDGMKVPEPNDMKAGFLQEKKEMKKI
jgi:hypothetical protein